MDGLTVAVVGVTGAVGSEMLRVMEQRSFPVRKLIPMASARSAGGDVEFGGQSHRIVEASAGGFSGVDVALFSAGAAVSRSLAPAAAAAGAVVIDNSSAFRMDPACPLVVPEVNASALGSAGRGTIIANPNCTTIVLVTALDPVRRAFGLKRLVVSTYQAASGAGARGLDELRRQARAAAFDEPFEPRMFHEPYAFNLFCHDAAVDPDTGLNGEEAKVIAESRRIWGDPGLAISATCVRVPVMRAHSESVNAELRRPATTEEVVAAFDGAPGVRLVDDRRANSFPTPLKASGGDDVLVGRIRPDPGMLETGAGPGESGGRGGGGGRAWAFDFFIAGDQVRKGAALNAVQIAELVVGVGAAALH